MRISGFPLWLAVAALAGCGGSANTPTTPSGPPAISTDRFDSIIEVGGSALYPFVVNQNGATTSVNLASLSSLTRPGLLPVTMRLSIGTQVKDDDGNLVDCNLTRSVDTVPGLSSQLTDQLGANTNYCVLLRDIGNLKEPANFTLRVSHP